MQKVNYGIDIPLRSAEEMNGYQPIQKYRKQKSNCDEYFLFIQIAFLELCAPPSVFIGASY
jgi:hypothetical protein